MKPYLEEVFKIEASSASFIAALRERVNKGLLNPQSKSRSNYIITEPAPEIVQITASGWWTASNIGLNDLNIDLRQSGTLHLRLHYWRWAIYCILLCFTIALGGVIMLIKYDQNTYFAWGSLAFWGLIWPWILISWHKRPLRKFLEKFVKEVDAAALGNSPDMQ